MNPSGPAPWGGKATTLKAIKHLLKNAPIPITSSLVYSSLNRNKNIKINKEIKYINPDSLVKSIFNQMNWLDDHISQKSNAIPQLLTFLSFKRKYLRRVLHRTLKWLKKSFHWKFDGRNGVTSDCLNYRDPRARGLIDQKPIVVILWSDPVNVEIGQQIS